MTCLGRSELVALLGGLRHLVLEERVYDGIDAKGAPKRWHVFRCIRRRGAHAGSEEARVRGAGC